MAPKNDDLDDLDDVIIDEGEEESDDDFSFDGDEEEFEDDDGKIVKRPRNEGQTFDRDSYYAYKDKLIQLSGTIRPKERDHNGKVVSLEFKTSDKVYLLVMDTMGQKLMTSLYQEMLITGLVQKISEKEFHLTVKTYL